MNLDAVAAALVVGLGLVGIDPRQLRPVDLVRLLNSTPLGEVAAERLVHRHWRRAGMRISSEKNHRCIDLLRYAGWLAIQRAEAARPRELEGYEAHKERMRARLAELSLSGRDIGELPPVLNPERKERCRLSLRAFCEEYFPKTFPLKWSKDHLNVIAKIERAVLHGGLFAIAMPRGSGKTSLCEVACIWATVYGHRRFVVLVGPTEPHAGENLESIKTELENNQAMLDDFPEVVYPIHRLEGIHQRASGQLYHGKPTNIGWTAHAIELPTLDDAPSAGCIIKVAGLSARLRGLKHKRVDGTTVRPDLVLVDDPQTEESAHSKTQTDARERTLAGAILGLAGPTAKIAGLMTLTVICQDDLADRILDREKHPEWQAERTKLVYEFPKHEKFWTKYAELWREGMQADPQSLEAATAYYAKHRKAMDAGAVVAWDERFEPGEISALQCAMNKKLKDEGAFWAEYQNDPRPLLPDDTETMNADQIAAKVNGLNRAEVPQSVNALTMFIDVQGKALFWLVAGWEADFTGYVVDYGTEPEQGEGRFTLRDLRKTLMSVAPRAGLHAAIYSGLERLCERTLGREWRRDDGAMVRIDRCLIDANWGSTSDVVYQFCRQSKFASSLIPSHGRYVGASSIPFSEYKRRPGDRVGLNWRIPIVTGKRIVRHITFDTNYWKSFVHTRLAVPMGDPGCLSLFGRAAPLGRRPPHALISEHLTAEYRVKTEGRNRVVDEWRLRVAQQDNHWLDCLVGAAVAASMQGSVLFGTELSQPVRRKIKLSEIQRSRPMRK